MPPDAPVSDRATFDALARFIKANLIKAGAMSGGEPFRALSETAVRFNDTRWFWTDDNAKAAELFSEPRLYDQDPAPADDAIDFVLRMSPGPVIQRRGGPAELRVLSREPSAFRVETAFFIISGDLTRGIVNHALRFNDGRTATAAQHTGNYITFRRGLRTVTRHLRGAIVATAVEDVGERAVALSFTCALRRGGGRRARPSAHIAFRFLVDADRPSVSLTVTLSPAPGTTLRDVVMATAVDQLTGVPGGAYRSLVVSAGGRTHLLHEPADHRDEVHAGPADYCVAVQEAGSPGFSLGVHTLLCEGARLASIAAVGQHGGALHMILHRYALGDVTAGTPGVLREERMLTGGGYYEDPGHYADVMRHARGGGEGDPSMTYDIGAELNAVAVHVLFARAGRYAAPPSPERLDALTAWFDRHVDRYIAAIHPGRPGDLDRVFTRGIAFVVLGLDCMLRATGAPRYRAMLDVAVRLILRLARRERRGRGTWDVTFADTWSGHIPFLDCHAACILALARAVWHGDPDGALGRAIHEGITGIRLHSGEIDLGRGHNVHYDGLGVHNTPDLPHVDPGFWTFKLGMVLRALHAARHAARAGVIPMQPDEEKRLTLRLGIARDLVAACCHRRADGIEVVTSAMSGETNSETQPWVALGLYPVVDELVTASPVPRAPQRAAEPAPIPQPASS